MSEEPGVGDGSTERCMVPGTLRGYRTWRPARRFERVPTGMLPITSVTRRDILWTASMMAACEPNDLPTAALKGRAPSVDHMAPEAQCKCGIYACYTPDDTALPAGRVFGAIEASGLVLLCDRGFRAERARVAAVVTRNSRVREACKAAGITVYRRRRDLLRDYPPEDVSSLLDEVEPDPPEETPRLLDGIDRTLMLAIWVRTVLLVVAPFALPIVAVLLFAAVAEVALFGYVMARVH